jgi:uncharacterized tellurite resistance protein B-like protein
MLSHATPFQQAPNGESRNGLRKEVRDETTLNPKHFQTISPASNCSIRTGCRGLNFCHSWVLRLFIRRSLMQDRAMRLLAATLLLTSLVSAACRSEDPQRAALRTRLTQNAPLSNVELAQLRAVVAAAVEGKHLRIREGAERRDLDPEERHVVLGMLTEPAGMFDEGLRQQSGETFRVLNAPGLSADAEIEATRRLWIDLETFLPRHFEFAYAFSGHGDYAFDLVVER